MHIIYFQDARLLDWANEKLGLSFREESCRWVAGLADGGVIFVVVYNGFSPRSCSLTIATDGSKRWASRATLKAIFEYPFVTLALPRVTFAVRSDNAASLKMMRKNGRSPLGVTYEGRLRDYFADGVDAVVFGMLKKECRWIA